MKRFPGVTLLLCAIGVNSMRAQTDMNAVLDTIQLTAFNFFWNEANPDNGLIRDRARVDGSTPSYIPSSIASVGFGLSAICIGVDHGWVSRADASARVLTTLKTFWKGPQGIGDGYSGLYGLYYHMLDMSTATRTWSSELSTIDTGLLLAGIIDAKQYFDGSDPAEVSIRAYADSIYYRMNWDLMRNFHDGILLGYMPGHGFAYDAGGGNIVPYPEWVGYCEASIMYIMAMGSPTYPVDYRGWAKWTSGYQWHTEYGYQYVVFPPLFGHQYSQCWIDFRGIQDTFMRAHGIDYFENSRRATLAQRAYCAANPGGFVGYSDSLWGITASDVPGSLHSGNTYMARGAPPAQDDDGTITPTAPISSIAFAPDSVISFIRNLWNNYRSQVWTKYGFRDAFNLSTSAPWYDTDVIGIDQGPIIIMIENYRTGRVWNRFMKNADVQRGLQAAGFLPTTGIEENASPVPQSFELEQNYPNPFNPTTVVSGQWPVASVVRLTVYDVLGREVGVLADGRYPAGKYSFGFNARGLASGVYFYRLSAGSYSATKAMLLER